MVIMANSVRLYTIAFEKDGKPISNLSILDFFENVEKHLDSKNRAKKIYNKLITCSRFYKDNNNEDRIIVSFGKLKEGSSFKYSKDMSFEELSLEIFNVNSFEYDEREKIFAITTNGTGPSIKYIESYLNSFLPNDLEYAIKIRPLFQSRGMEAIRKANFIRSINFTLDLSYDLYDTNISTEESVFKGLINLARDTNKVLDTKRFVLSLGVGNRDKGSSLVLDSTLDMLEEIDLNQNFIKEISVTYKNDKEEKTTLTKLKEYKMLIEHYFSIKTNLISHEYLREHWDDLVREERSKYYPSKRKYFNNSVEADQFCYDLVSVNETS